MWKILQYIKQYRAKRIAQRLEEIKINDIAIARNINTIGLRLANKLIYLKNSPICVFKIVQDINSYKNTDTNKYLSIELKLKLIEKMEENLLLIDDELRITLQGIKDKIYYNN